jgi:hypothetical protein
LLFHIVVEAGLFSNVIAYSGHFCSEVGELYR